MKERPILFSGPMVQAILEGRKTQTRRIVKPQPPVDSVLHRYTKESDQNELARSFGWFVPEAGDLWPCDRKDRIRCPYGRPGDRLWVRETWAHCQTVNSLVRASGASFDEIGDGMAGYRADGYESIEDFRDHIRLMSDESLVAVEINGDRWRPSIHMPRWASRITLEIKAVRVERLQDISEDDAIAEGVDAVSMADLPRQATWSRADDFRQIWQSIHGLRSWDENPWVWVIEFERVNQ